LPVGVERAAVVAGRGLEGDRYFDGKGTFSHWRGTGRALTLVEAEALDDVGLDWAAARRNVVTRGVGLNDLVGKRFRLGEVECAGRRFCEPCRHFEQLTEDGMLRALAGRGGLRADVLTSGEIRVGDALVELA
jgi:MOSC domain-containing protein YiiM